MPLSHYDLTRKDAQAFRAILPHLRKLKRLQRGVKDEDYALKAKPILNQLMKEIKL